jgi:hypothetical protein
MLSQTPRTTVASSPNKTSSPAHARPRPPTSSCATPPHWRYAQDAAALLRRLRTTAAELVALKTQRTRSAALYVGTDYLNRNFIFPIDDVADNTEHNDDADHNNDRFDALLAEADALLSTIEPVAAANAPPKLPMQDDAPFWTAVHEAMSASD